MMYAVTSAILTHFVRELSPFVHLDPFSTAFRAQKSVSCQGRCECSAATSMMMLRLGGSTVWLVPF